MSRNHVVLREEESVAVNVDADALVKHLSILRLGGRIKEIKFGPDFEACVLDENDQTACRGLLSGDKPFKDKFAVTDLQSLLKVVLTFDGNISMGVKDDKLVLRGGGVTVRHQLADPDLICTTFLNFDEVMETFGKKPMLSFTLEPDLLKMVLSYTKLISPRLAIFKIEKGGKAILELKSMSGHQAVIDLRTEAEAEGDEEGILLSLSADALVDVLGGVQKIDDPVEVHVCDGALRIHAGVYTFMIEPETTNE